MAVTTPKARRLGAALKEARVERGVGLRQLAEKLGKDHSTISRYESGQRIPKLEEVAHILGVLQVNADQRDDILDLARGADSPRWLAVSLPDQRQQLAALLELERTASTIIDVSPLLVNGLLQTTPYIRAIMSGGGVSPTEIELRVATRVGRREVLRDMSIKLMAVLGEAALRQQVGGAEVMADQLRHLVDVAELPNVDLRVIPFGVGWHPALEGPFTLIDSSQVPSAVHLENRRSGLWLHEPEDIESYREAARVLMDEALGAKESVGLIAALAHEMET
ncbi:transcriptional regulator [Actinophytocola xinjiangensis]|uniref:Transcriptional regulator n=1 Tax=Actinophytocola xinjiangensis TaxID=485602 RepID=A0A7Z1AUB8_9PSEU|nr:helix-turn-helix transcriptional regulator [Actinophytocola xinjiangensis]OLF05387.1 transcriptional regulator [Actinophytocola xinjiangensis]